MAAAVAYSDFCRNVGERDVASKNWRLRTSCMSKQLRIPKVSPSRCSLFYFLCGLHLWENGGLAANENARVCSGLQGGRLFFGFLPWSDELEATVEIGRGGGTGPLWVLVLYDCANHLWNFEVFER